jgi:AraC-like DNA-binding protein
VPDPLLDARTEVRRHASELGSWEMVSRPPHPTLRPHVLRYTGYREDMAAPVRRREAPWGGVILIFSFGEQIRLGRADAPGRPPEVFTSFAAGLDESAGITEHRGRQHGIEVALTPLGGYTLLALPMRELANLAVHVTDLLGPAGDEITDRLAAAPTWDARFRLLDEVLAARAAAGPVPAPEVAWAWQRLARSAGRVSVSELAAEVGWSQRHLSSRFRAQVGLPPKALARVLRFQRAVRLLGDPAGPSWSEAAVACGYYDQAHLNRDFRALAGCTPTEYLAARLPDGGGVAGY